MSPKAVSSAWVIAGIASVVFGVSQWSPPAAWIVFGGIVFMGGVLAYIQQSKETK